METYEKYIGEATPYPGSIAHIQKVYGTNYKVVFSPNTSLWYVQGQQTPKGEWVPVTPGFPDNVSANEFSRRLAKVETDQKKMLSTIGVK